MSSTRNQGAVAPPAIGGLLRLAWQIHRDHLYERVRAAGFADVTRAQFALIRWPTLDGVRPGQLADSVGLSKQAVNDLLGELDRNGYIERHPDPADRRARIVRLTARGQQLQRTSHEMSRALEAAWAASIGADRFSAFRSSLQDLVERGLPDG